MPVTPLMSRNGADLGVDGGPAFRPHTPNLGSADEQDGPASLRQRAVRGVAEIGMGRHHICTEMLFGDMNHAADWAVR